MKRWPLALAVLFVLLAAPPAALARPPLFTLNSIAAQTATATKLYQYQVTYRIEDPTCFLDNVSFKLTSAPAGMLIHASSGLLGWTPTSGQVGQTFNVTVSASAKRANNFACGGYVHTSTASFTVRVVAPPPFTDAAVEVHYSNGLPPCFGVSEQAFGVAIQVKNLGNTGTIVTAGDISADAFPFVTHRWSGLATGQGGTSTLILCASPCYDHYVVACLTGSSPADQNGANNCDDNAYTAFLCF